MIYLYPANKMENLLALFVKIQQISPLPVLSPEVIIVNNAGMQHWLNLTLAKQRDISLNNYYALPSQYLWQLVRSVANGNAVPKQAPYSREVLVWRIDKLLASDAILTDNDFEQINRYWNGNVDNKVQSEKARLKRFQLATELADLYEQYLIFRPQWLDNWQQCKVKLDTDIDLPNAVEKRVRWQAKLWQLLTQEIAYNPKTLIRDAIANIKLNKQLLPPRISFVGINSLAPIWLEFISALSEHIDVHFFHLNPCYDYWGDLLTEKQAVKSLSTWLDPKLPLNEQIQALVGNPLLANFGQQGREFLALLQQYSTVNIEAFERQIELIETKKTQLTALVQLQNDILSLVDARVTPTLLIDDSVVITNAHSALREVQGLHDWLLHQFNQHTKLTPKDVLVMCPQVENYAPYIDAVFNRGEQNIGESVPSLPCSISDRISKESEPLVIAFIELLQLPDSRFQVSKLISFLRLPAMQAKFDLTIENIEKITVWLDQATIHWGLNAAHKQQILTIEKSNDYFTWDDGLARLLLGFAYGDEAVIYQHKLLLPTIEGNDATLLGKLLQILEQLQFYATNLASAKSAPAWLNCLNGLLSQLFSLEDDPVIEVIDKAINALVDHCNEANYDELISLCVVREFLGDHFSQPDPGRQFLVGQVTFCSMLPMRSIPFKIIAILGLNDGEFPRQRQPLGFDLMAVTPAKIGDRSRRGDDRYLFLEAIICARQSLYLSYQGRNIRNNNVLQPSLVLKELMEYLDLGYGWSLLNKNNSNRNNNEHIDQSHTENQTEQHGIKYSETTPYSSIRQLAMQPFSLRNYQQGSSQGNITDPYLSFDSNWLKIETHHCSKQQPPLFINEDLFNKNPLNSEQAIEISLTDLIKFFDHPSKYFAKKQLNLHFEQYKTELNDSEPFNNDGLASYQLQQELLITNLAVDNCTTADQAVTDTLLQASLSGKFPDSPLTQQYFLQWQQEANKLATVIKENKGEIPTLSPYRLLLNVADIKVVLTADLPIKNNQCVTYRNTKSKAKDHLTLYLYRLFSIVYQQQLSASKNSFIKSTHEQLINQVTQAKGWYFDAKNNQILEHSFTDINEPKSQLMQLISTFLKGQQQALLVNVSIGEKYSNSKEFGQVNFEKYWSDPNIFNALSDDNYIQFFWPECPQFSDHSNLIEQLYQVLYHSIKTTKIKDNV